MKAYVKPDLVYENFELSDSVAVCMWDMVNNKNKNDCVAEPDGKGDYLYAPPVTLFTETPRCGSTPEIMGPGDDYCYQVGTNNVQMVFNS